MAQIIILIIVAIILAFNGMYYPLIGVGVLFAVSVLIVFIVDLFTPADKKPPKKKRFKKIPYEGTRSLENNFDGVISNPSWEQVEKYINKIFEDKEEYVILSLPQSEYGMKYIQAAIVDNVISVQVGLYTESGNRLVEKRFAKSSLMPLFTKYYKYGYVDLIEEFYTISRIS